MKSALAVSVLGLAGLLPGVAGKLPVLLDKPFIGCFVGFTESRDYEFALGGDGASELFFKKGRNRHTTSGCTLHLDYVVEERDESKGRWVSRKMKEDGFDTAEVPTDQPEPGKPVVFTATYTGDTRVEITHLFTKKGVEISSRLVEKKTANEVRVGVKVLVGDMFRHIKEGELPARELKAKLRDTEVVIWPVEADRSSGVKVRFYEIGVKLPEKFPKGARKVSLESDRLADHEYTLATARESLGRFEFRQKRALLHGFSIYWWPDPAQSDERDCRLLIGVK